jgi:hypothetical protein
MTSGSKDAQEKEKLLLIAESKGDYRAIYALAM